MCIFLQWLKFENEVVENVGVVVDELGCDIIVNLATNLLNTKSIHLQCDNNLFENDELHLVAIEFQVQK
jgi:hypothetical protein